MSASGTSETNGFSRFESAIGVRSDVGLPVAQGLTTRHRLAEVATRLCFRQSVFTQVRRETGKE
jgi:hypothetical protein